jgi:signal transduction histidine kinase
VRRRFCKTASLIVETSLKSFAPGIAPFEIENATRRAEAGMHLPAHIQPLRVFAAVLVAVFLTETLVMFLMPLLAPAGLGRSSAAVLDACLLTALLAPILSWTVAAPLRRASTIRSRLLKQFLALQEEERRRIACDLHDEIGQSLTAVLVGLRTLENAGTTGAKEKQQTALRETVMLALNEVRRLARGLRPVALDHLGLGPALELYAENFSRTHGSPVEVRMSGLDGERLPADVEITAYRIVQEALTNVARHAHARHVQVVVERRPSALHLAIRDDGCGFDAAEVCRAPAEGMRLGLSGMEERAALLGGTFAIDSKPGRGAKVTAMLPCRSDGLPKTTQTTVDFSEPNHA